MNCYGQNYENCICFVLKIFLNFVPEIQGNSFILYHNNLIVFNRNRIAGLFNYFYILKD